MFSPDHNDQLHQLIAELELSCLQEWTRLKHRPFSPGDALAMAAKEMNTDLKRKPGGKISVTISIHTARSYGDEHWWFSLQTKDFRGYLVTGSSSTIA